LQQPSDAVPIHKTVFLTNARHGVMDQSVCSPQSDGMAESFVKTMKRDYVAFMLKADAATAASKLAIVFEHYNEKHSHRALKYRSPREFRHLMDSETLV
jgi:putative transposase